jgi:hypothetical protein
MSRCFCLWHGLVIGNRAAMLKDVVNDVIGITLRHYKHFEVLPDHARPSVQISSGAVASVLLDKELAPAWDCLRRATVVRLS